MNKVQLKYMLKEALNAQQVALIHSLQQKNPQLASNLMRAVQEGTPIQNAAQQFASYYYSIQQPVPQELEGIISNQGTTPQVQPAQKIVAPMQVQPGRKKPSVQGLKAARASSPAPKRPKKIDVSRLRSGSKPKIPQAQPQLPPVSTLQPGELVPQAPGLPEPSAHPAGTQPTIPATRPGETAGAAVEEEAAKRAQQARGESSRERYLKGHHMKYKDNPQYQAWFKQQPQEFQDKMNTLVSQQERSEQSTVAPPRRRKKQMAEQKIKNKTQLKRAVRNAVIREHNKKLVKKVLQKQIQEQVFVKKTAEKLLQEGIWDRIKAAGSAVGEKMGLGGQSDVMGQGDMAQRREQQIKKVTTAIDQALKKAGQQRQKFNSQVLKSAEMMNAYHTSVMRAFELYKRFEDILGPAGMQVNRQINDVLEALEEDLMSEISQIEAMLKSVGEKDQSIDSRLKTHKEKAEEKREKEAEASARMRSDTGMTGEKMPMKMKMAKAPHKKAVGGEKEDSTPEQRVKAVDTASKKKMEDDLKEIQDTFDEFSKDLTKRILKAKGKEEKSNLMRQLMDLTKSKKDREKEIREKYSFTR